MNSLFVRILYCKENGRPSIKFKGAEAVFQQLNDLFGRNKDNIQVELWGELKKISDSKTKEQMGYYHAEVLKKAYIGLKEAGYQITTYDAHEFLKDRFFTKQVVNDKTGDIIKLPRSLAGASITEMAAYLNDCILFIENDLSTQVNPPK